MTDLEDLQGRQRRDVGAAGQPVLINTRFREAELGSAAIQISTLAPAAI
jgi:hypothetical protein